LPFTQKNKIKLLFTPILHAEQTACRTKYPHAAPTPIIVTVVVLAIAIVIAMESMMLEEE
jgi:hypothetical protein